MEQHPNALSSAYEVMEVEPHTEIPLLANPNKVVPYLLLLAVSKTLADDLISAWRLRTECLPSDCT